MPHFTGGRLRGRVRVDGHDPVAAGPRVLSRVVGFVFQDPEAQFVVDRVEAEIAFALENLALPRTEMRALVEGALDLRPRILALDEPTSQLDAESAEEVLQALVRLNREQGLTIVLAEHRLERILAHASQVVYLPEPGEPIRSGPPREVLREIELVPPVVALGKALGWEPLPLTVEAARPERRPAAAGCPWRGHDRSSALAPARRAHPRIGLRDETGPRATARRMESARTGNPPGDPRRRVRRAGRRSGADSPRRQARRRRAAGGYPSLGSVSLLANRPAFSRNQLAHPG